MSDTYKIKIHSHNPEVAEKLIGGTGLFHMLNDTIGNLGKQMSENRFMPSDSPFFALTKSDFDVDDPIVAKFFDNGGIDNAVKIIKLQPKDAHAKMVECYNDLYNFRTAKIASNLRAAFNALQNAIDSSNDAVRMERIASKAPEKSAGYWQIETLNNIDKGLRIANTTESKALRYSRDLVLSGDKDFYVTAAKLLKSIFSDIYPKANTRVAYTTLSTQDNEPFLMCPKGIYQGKHTVPMEVSKCRENCIDSRVSKDGVVTCAYQDWLKVAFEPHEKVMARLYVHRHPDNDETPMEIAEGERGHKLKDTDFGYEARFENSDRGANKVRGKQDYSKSVETQISDMKSSSYGHTREDEPRKRPKQAQSNPSKVIEDQLPRKSQKGDQFLEALLNKLNRVESETEEVRENQLENKSLYNRRGEMEESYAVQLENRKQENIDYKDELNKDNEEPTESIAHQLNKTASKTDTTLNGELEQSRRNISTEDTKEMQLKEKRTISKDSDIDKSIQSLLDEDDDYHQFSDEDLKHFAHELGLDSYLEDLRTDNDIES